MSQIIVYGRDFEKKDIIITDVIIKNYDCITPQKTTFEVLQTDKIEDGDYVIIRDSKDFIGVVDSVGGVNTTEVAVYPIEHIFDNELDVDNLDGTINIVEYLQNQIERNFVNTDDKLMRVPFIFENTLQSEVKYKTIIDGSNLLDIMNDIYLNTGVYLDYEAVYNDAGKFANIKIIFKNVSEQKIKVIRYDHPQIIDKVNYEFSGVASNKVTIYVGKTEESKGTAYKVYLRTDNNLTTNPTDPYRIKKVINKNIDLSAKVETDEELAEAVILTAQKELQGDVFGYKIEFTMLRNADWHYRQACVFRGIDKTYNTLVTRIEYLSEKHMRITLGAYRTKLHEKIIKMNKKPAEIGTTLGGIQTTNGLGKNLYWLEKDENDNLYICSEQLSESELTEKFELDSQKNLWVNYEDNQRQALSINADGELQGDY